MVYQVQDPALLKQVKVGDKVQFDAEQVNGVLSVTEDSEVRVLSKQLGTWNGRGPRAHFILLGALRLDRVFRKSSTPATSEVTFITSLIDRLPPTMNVGATGDAFGSSAKCTLRCVTSMRPFCSVGFAGCGSARRGSNLDSSARQELGR